MMSGMFLKVGDFERVSASASLLLLYFTLMG